jgi:hypothetical protein
MKQVTITTRNGLTLPTSVVQAIDPEKIVTTRDAGGVAEIVYGESFDRRNAADTLIVTDSKATIDALVSGDTIDLPVFDLLDGSTSTLTLQDKYNKVMEDSFAVVNGVKTAGVIVNYIEGAFGNKIVFVDSDLATLAP